MNVKYLGRLFLLSVILSASSCPCGDPTEAKFDGMIAVNIDNTGETGVVSSSAIPAVAYAIGLRFSTELASIRNRGWSIIPMAYATSCDPGQTLIDSIKTIHIQSLYDFSTDMPAGSDLAAYFLPFEFNASNYEATYPYLEERRYFLFEAPEEEGEQQFVIQVETYLGSTFTDTTDVILLTL